MGPEVWAYLQYVLGAVGVFGAGIITTMAMYIRSKDKDHNETVVDAFDKVTDSIDSLIKTINDNETHAREDLLKHRLKLEASLERLLREVKSNEDPKKGDN